jgi:hypothetical protein
MLDDPSIALANRKFQQDGREFRVVEHTDAIADVVQKCDGNGFLVRPVA